MKIDRLISIIMLLLEHDKISAPKLAEMFEVSTRTIYRDLDAILLSGVPIVTQPGYKGGIFISKEYKVEKSFFSKNDLTSLLRGLISISPTVSNPELLGTVSKIKNLIPQNQIKEIEFKSSQVSIDLTPWMGNANIQDNLDKIKLSLNENFIIEFDYLDRNRNSTTRKVEPYQLVLKDGSWYLQGYCLIRNDYRVFKLFRMVNLKVLNENFSARDFQAKPLGSGKWVSDNLFTVKVLIHKSIIEKIAEKWGNEIIHDYDEERFLVEHLFSVDDFSYDLLLSYGDKCQVLEPQHVKEELVKRINNMLNLYK